MQKKNRLSVIIPFLNEKEEVENTINSLLDYSKGEVDIIVINDASDDGFDYKKIGGRHNLIYIENEKRMGVAASRDLGVSLCKTPFFLLLDAHMRFYDKNWVERIIEELDSTPNSLLCCQTLALHKKDEEISILERKTSYGACVNLYESELLFEPLWIFDGNYSNNGAMSADIPCVLGAGYACSKDYWLYLKGLEGLCFYGNDEAYISIKVWLSGGQCRLLKDVVIGHIYRDNPPYAVENKYRLYNRLLINKLLVKDPFKYRSFISQMRKNPLFSDAYYCFYEKRKEIENLEDYYNKIFKFDFSFFEKINNQSGKFKDRMTSENQDLYLKNIAYHTLLNFNKIQDAGILYGKMGILIFLFYYAEYSNNTIFWELSEELLDKFCTSLNIYQSYCFNTGLTGIGWGISYLYQNKFIDGNINEILEEIDKKVMEANPIKIDDLSIETGIGGIFLYVLSRMHSIKKEQLKNPFDEQFLESLFLKAKSILDEEINSNAIYTISKYADYYIKGTIEEPLIYDITTLFFPNDHIVDSYTSGLNGNAGVGLKLILEQNYVKIIKKNR
jgi:glycosyltransferase involved in cell wall biosynthesis